MPAIAQVFEISTKMTTGIAGMARSHKVMNPLLLYVCNRRQPVADSSMLLSAAAFRQRRKQGSETP